METGKTHQFTARLYNAKGQFLKPAQATFKVKGSGEVNEQGLYTAPKGTKHEAAFVTAEVDGLSGTARIRIVPPLPWKFEFTDKQIPITWIGARYRHVFREVDNEPMIVKITTIPLGTRSQCFFGPTSLHDYTVQADVRGAKNADNGYQPDIGLVNSRYTLDMMGRQQLQIRSWSSRLALRFAVTVPFEWKPDVWYTLKFQSENKEGAITLRGKAWPRGEKEPEEWTVEGTDVTPNVEGSPGLFGKALDAEIFIDNVAVSSNK